MTSESGDRVQFLVAGVQKGGTTALHAMLQQVPALSMSWPKELHFFDDEAVDWSEPDYVRYEAAWPMDRGGVRGESTPIYIYWPESLARARRYNPDIKVVLTFRDPVERAWSQWQMETGRAADDAPFSWAIREGRSRVANSPNGAHRVYSYVERGFYGDQLKRALEIFPQRQLLCLRSEDVRTRSRATIAQVCRFLGVDLTIEVIPVEAHVGQGAEIPPEDGAYLAELYKEDLSRFSSLSGLDVSLWASSGAGRAAR